MAIKSNIIDQINHCLDLFEGQSFSENREFHVSPGRRFCVSIRVPDRQKNIQLMGLILKKANQLAHEGEEIEFGDLDVFDVRTPGQMSIYGRSYTVLNQEIDPKFIAKIREYVHVYFYSLMFGWNFVEGKNDFRWKKTEHPAIAKDQYRVLSFLAREAETFLTVSIASNLAESYIGGSIVEFEKFIDFVEETAGAISPSLLKERISIDFLENRSIGTVSIQALERQIRKELWMKAGELTQM